MRIELAYPIYLSEIIDNETTFDDRIIRYVCTDSRLLQSADLFITLKGERYNGKDFAKYAIDMGATVISDGEISTVRVSTIEKFLEHFIFVYKSKITSLVKTIAITGSVGKTSTKTVLSTLLSKKFKVHATKENQNNLLGTFYTVLSTPKDTEMLVLELGMNHPGEISLLSNATTPDIAIITNIGSAHIGNLGGKEMIAKSKSEIVDGMRGGTVIIPADEELLAGIKGKSTLSFNKNCNADILFTKSSAHEGKCIYNFQFQNTNIDVKFDSYDKRLINALGFSISVCSLLGLSPDDIKKNIEETEEWNFRQRLIKENGYKIYDDTYSSSYEAVICVVDTLITRYGKISCVLGDILELGVFSEKIHAKLGKELSKRNIDKLYLFGRHAKNIEIGIKENIQSNISVYINEDLNQPDITAKQIKQTYDGEVLLIKGSKKTHTERIIELLIH